ncbi:MAG: hypothetical protein ACOC80_12350 [Petrotogales bacterium]
MHNNFLKQGILFAVIVFLLVVIVVPGISGNNVGKYLNFGKNDNNKYQCNSSGWQQLIGNTSEGFGRTTNYAVRGIEVYDDHLYIGVENLNKSKVLPHFVQNKRRYNGRFQYEDVFSQFHSILKNKLFFSLFRTRNVKCINHCFFTHWLSTALNLAMHVRTRMSDGCEVWCYNETSWTPIVKDVVGEIDNGFGYIYNEGARAMIEYPPGSGNIVVGTFKVVKPYLPSEGCEVWMRIA